MRETAIRTELFTPIDEKGKTPKFLQIVNGIIAQIERGVFQPGDRLPSINETSEEYYLARATVEKAYRNLLRSGYVTSLYRKGFFIAEIKKVKRVLFLAGKITENNRAIFNAIGEQLGKSYKVDIYAYDYRRDYLVEILEKQANYSHFFVLMPFHWEETEDLQKALQKIPSERLILLDGTSTATPSHCSFVRFSSSEYFREILEQNATLFRKYNTLHFVTTDNEYIPTDWYSTFLAFAENHGLESRVLDAADEIPLQKGIAYLLFDDHDLVAAVQETNRKRLTLGKEVGVVSFTDACYKEVFAGGISVIKTDISAISRSLSGIITQNRKQHIRIPMQFIQRGSL
jgi:DNA-binding transcriptional regulator YhcF (GntR family)